MSIFTRSFVTIEVTIGAVLACFLVPLLTQLPCEKRRDDGVPDNVKYSCNLKKTIRNYRKKLDLLYSYASR